MIIKTERLTGINNSVQRLILDCIATMLFVCISCMDIYAQSGENDFRVNKNVVTLSGVLSAYGSDPALGAEFSYYRYMLPYVGVAAGFAYQNWGDNVDKPSFEVTDRQGLHYTLDEDGKLKRLHFIVGLSLRTPPLKIGKEEYYIFCQCDPAVVFTIPNEKFAYSRMYQEGNMAMVEWKTAKNHGGKSNFWRVKSSISLGIDEVILSIGYTISNQDPYSGRRNVLLDGHLVSDGMCNHRFTHEFFVSAGYSF